MNTAVTTGFCGCDVISSNGSGRRGIGWIDYEERLIEASARVEEHEDKLR